MITALNGRLPSTLLVVADTGANGPQSLRPDAAASWARMLAAAMPAGCLRSGYRTLADQAAQDPRLAAPVGQSQHGEGLAADVDEPARSWIAAHGAPYGWRIGFVPREPWHAEYDPTRDTAPEDDMTPDQSAKLDAIYATLTPGQAGVKTAGDISLQLGRIEADAHAAADAVTPGQAGVRTAGSTVAQLASLSAQVAGLTTALGQIKTGAPIDLAAVTAAAEAGAKEALNSLTLKAQVG